MNRLHRLRWVLPLVTALLVVSCGSDGDVARHPVHAPSHLDATGGAYLTVAATNQQVNRLTAPRPTTTEAPANEDKKQESEETLLTWPLIGRVSSEFGPRMHPILKYVRIHRGLDISGPSGRPIVAAGDGTVIHSGRLGGYGNTIIIDHGNGLMTLYGHMLTTTIRAGSPVDRGAIIGLVGSTGLSTGPHLHFETRNNGKATNPRLLLAPPANP